MQPSRSCIWSVLRSAGRVFGAGHDHQLEKATTLGTDECARRNLSGSGRPLREILLQDLGVPEPFKLPLGGETSRKVLQSQYPWHQLQQLPHFPFRPSLFSVSQRRTMGPGSAIHMHKSTSPVLYRRGHATGRQYSWDPLPPGNPQAPPKETSLVRRIFVDYVRIKLRVLVPALVALGLGVVAAAHFYTKRFIIEPVTALLTTTPASPAAQISAAQRLRWAIVSERVAEQYAESNVVPLLLGVLQAGATVEVTHEVVMTLEALVAYPSTARVMLVHGGIRTLQALLRDPHLPLATGTTCAEVLQVLLDTKERDKVIVQGGGTG